MAVAAGLDPDAEHLALAADRQRMDRAAGWQLLRRDLGREDRRVPDLREEREPADMVLVAVAEHQRIDAADVIEIGHSPGCGP